MDGAFIVFEGVEGGGKSTQIRLLSNQLHERGLAVLNTIEPGQTRAGRAIRDVLLDPETGSLEPMAETLLYEADRAEHVARVVRPALERGEIVLCDR
ncbi:MAG: dTMP kinase, partial [Terriglobia bacterium]